MSTRWNETETFIQNLAHDLRQPLSEIEALIYCLETSAGGDNARIRVLTNLIRNQVERTDAILCGAVRDAGGFSDLPSTTGLELSLSQASPSGV
jgi:signal transduction histidine kinase